MNRAVTINLSRCFLRFTFCNEQVVWLYFNPQIPFGKKTFLYIMSTSPHAIWLGHSAFKLQSPGGKIIYIDPFLTHNPKTPDEFKSPSEADYILLTHGHEDHVGDTLAIAAETGAQVVSIVELSHLLKADGLNPEQAVEFNKGGTLRFDDFTVTMTNANHSSSNG